MSGPVQGGKVTWVSIHCNDGTITRRFAKRTNVASGIVHAGKFKKSQSNRDLLAATQDICRKGILERLAEKRLPEWDKVILGSENDPG